MMKYFVILKKAIKKIYKFIKVKINQAVRTYKLISKLTISTSGYDKNSQEAVSAKIFNSYIRMTRVFLNQNEITIKIRRPEKTRIILDQNRAIQLAKVLNQDYVFSNDDGLDPDYIVIKGNKNNTVRSLP